MSDIGITSPFKYVLSGSVACVGAGLAAVPYDNIKGKMKKDPHKYPNFISTMNTIARKDGFADFFRGAGKDISAMFPFFALSFFGYGLGKRVIHKYTQREELTKTELVAAGSFAGFLLATYTAAAQRASDLLKIQESKKYPDFIGPIHALKEQWRAGGIRRMFVGGVPTYLRDVPSCAVFFPSYELMRRCFRKPDEKKSTVGFWRTFVCGGTAGALLWLTQTPGNVLTKEMKIAPGNYAKLGNSISSVMRDGGPLAFYHGKFPLLIRAIPAHAFGFVVFEYIRKFANHELPKF